MKPAVRALILGTVLAAPLGVYSCNRLTEKPAIVKAIETERKALQMKEGEFASKLYLWTNWFTGCGMGVKLRVPEGLEILKQIDVAGRELENTINGPTSENFIDNINKIVGTNLIQRKPRNDFRTQPSEDQVEAFNKLVVVLNKAIPLVVVPKDHGAFLLQEYIESFKIYTEMLDDLAKETPKLIELIEKFNETAKAANQAPYEPTWGLSLELLKSLKSIK